MPAPPLASCAFCGEPGSDRTCADCREHVYIDGLTFFSPYGNPVVRELIGHWKYQGDRSVESIFQGCLRRAALRLSPPVLPFYVTGVPLHEKRLRSRGFDQADLVAAWAGELFGIPHETYVRRVHSTSPQARTSHDLRRVGEMDGAFCVYPDVQVPDHILLCDDVFTSGTTMDAVARVLKEAGAKTVWGFVIAKG
ncbi:ComF family protein [Candidatus Uhrbacteria bacterium]|nr:ComF family protein [Candidatus Uhrbacteria bacterium]